MVLCTVADDANVPQCLPPCVCIVSLCLLSSPSAHLSGRPFARPMLRPKTSCHLFQHCSNVRPGTIAAIATQSLPPCVCSASFSLLSSYFAHLSLRSFARSMLGSNAFFHLLQHCFAVRPGTNTAIATQSLPPCSCTESFSLSSSSCVHLHTRPTAGPMLESKLLCHLP
jgi:hypothetical protein